MTVAALIADLKELAEHFGNHVEVVMPPRPLRMDQSLNDREEDWPIDQARYEPGKIRLR